MTLNIRDRSNQERPLNVPDDFRMDELFCELNGIGEEVPDEEVHARMATSDDGLAEENGKCYRFSDYANSNYTLAQLGIGGESKTYTQSGETTDGGISGGECD